MVKGIVFDVGGVLIPSLDKEIDGDIQNTLGLLSTEFDSLWAKYVSILITGKISEKDFWSKIVREINTNKKMPAESLFLREYCKNIVVNKEMLHLVANLNKNGYATAILSNSILPHSQYNRKIGLYDSFNIVILSNEVGMLKPNTDIYFYCLNKLKLKPSEVIFIDDKVQNIVAAESMGIKGIEYNNFHKLVNDLLSLGVLIE